MAEHMTAEQVLERHHKLLDEIGEAYRVHPQTIRMLKSIAARLSGMAAVPEGWKLVPIEPTPEIVAAAATAVWPTASANDLAVARQAAMIVLRTTMEPAPGATLEQIAAALATMPPAYRAMLDAAPEPPHV